MKMLENNLDDFHSQMSLAAQVAVEVVADDLSVSIPRPFRLKSPAHNFQMVVTNIQSVSLCYDVQVTSAIANISNDFANISNDFNSYLEKIFKILRENLQEDLLTTLLLVPSCVIVCKFVHVSMVMER